MAQIFSSVPAADMGRTAVSARDISCLSRADMLSTSVGRAAACGGAARSTAMRAASSAAWDSGRKYPPEK